MTKKRNSSLFYKRYLYCKLLPIWFDKVWVHGPWGWEQFWAAWEINESLWSKWAMELRDSLVTRWLWILWLCVLGEALQVDMCNKSKVSISGREQQLCLHPYQVMLTLPSGPSRSVRLEDSLIVYLKQLLNSFIKVLKIYFILLF